MVKVEIINLTGFLLKGVNEKKIMEVPYQAVLSDIDVCTCVSVCECACVIFFSHKTEYTVTLSGYISHAWYPLSWDGPKTNVKQENDLFSTLVLIFHLPR